MVVYAYHSSYMGSVSRRKAIQGVGANARLYLKNN
jgi:hypothetical protein